MQTKWKVLILTLAVTVVAFMFGAGSPQGQAMWTAVWPWAAEEVGTPPAALLPLYMGFGVLEGVALGLAISLLVWGRKAFVDLAGGNVVRGTWMCIATAWILGNWWVHDSLHIVNGHDYTGLIIIEYAFHATLIAAGAFLAYWVTTGVRTRKATTPSATPA